MTVLTTPVVLGLGFYGRSKSTTPIQTTEYTNIEKVLQ